MTELPDGWTVENIDSITKGGLISDGDWVESKDQDPSGQVRLTQLADVGDGDFRNRSDRWMNDEQASRLNVNYLKPGDLLLARMPDPLGRTCIVPENIGRAVTVVDVAIIRIVREDINTKCIMWLLNSPAIRQQIEMLASGTTRRRITRKNLGTIDLPVPPLPEQHKIVEILEDHLSRLDAALADVKQAKVKAAQFRRSLLQAAFTGNLGSDATRRMTDLPNGWKLSTIGEVSEIIRGVTYSKADTLSASDKDAIPLLRATNLEVDSINFEDLVYVPKRVVKTHQILRLNDIFLAASSGSISVVGKSAQVIKTNGETFGAFCAVIRPKNIHPKFLSYWVQSPEIRDHWSATAKGTNINNLKPSDIAETRIPIPPLPEQHKIVEILEDHLSRLDASVALADAMEKQSAGLRRSLMQAAFTGQLTKEVASV